MKIHTISGRFCVLGSLYLTETRVEEGRVAHYGPLRTWPWALLAVSARLESYSGVRAGLNSHSKLIT